MSAIRGPARINGPIQRQGIKNAFYLNMPLCSTSEAHACTKIKLALHTRNGLAQLFSDLVPHSLDILFALETNSIGLTVLELFTFLVAPTAIFAAKGNFSRPKSNKHLHTQTGKH